MIFRRKNFYKTFLLLIALISVGLLSPKPVRADLIVPGAERIITPWSLVLLLANLVINFFIFGLAYLVFVERKIKKIEKKMFFVALVLITLIGFLSDSALLHYWRYEKAPFTAFAILGILIAFFDYIVCRKILQLDHKKALELGIWMGIFTNPYVFPIVLYSLVFPLWMIIGLVKAWLRRT